jgi:hypothetical protein
LILVVDDGKEGIIWISGWDEVTLNQGMKLKSEFGKRIDAKAKPSARGFQTSIVRFHVHIRN